MSEYTLGKDALSNAVAWTFVVVMVAYTIAMLFHLIQWLYYEIRYRIGK